jgi:hypothetical protein
MLKILSILRCALDGLSYGGGVFRMDALENKFEGGCGRSIILKDSEGFL